MNVKKNILLSLLASLLISHAVQAQGENYTKVFFDMFRNTGKKTTVLTKEEKEEFNKDLEKDNEKRNLRLQADRENQYFLPASRQSNLSGRLSRNFEDHLVWSVGSAIFGGFQTLIFRGILDEGLKRVKRKIQRYFLASPLVTDEPIEKNLYLGDLILSNNIRDIAESIIGTFRNIEEPSGYCSTLLGGKKSRNRVSFNGYLFHGLHGTGKTKLAKTIASEIIRDTELSKGKNIKYYIVSGHKLASASLNEIEDFIGMIETTNALTIVVIDECETFLADTEGGQKKQMSKGVNAWVEYTGESSSHVQFFYMTNFGHLIDEKMHRRADFIEFKLPNLQERIKVLELYLDQIFLSDEEYSAQEKDQIIQLFNNSTVLSVAQRLCIPQADPAIYDSGNVFAPADIKIIMNNMKKCAIGRGCKGVPTISILNAELDAAIDRKKVKLVMKLNKKLDNS